MSEALDLLSARPGTRTWDEGKRCAECCTHMRCDGDCTDRDRENCPHCLGTGWALWTAAGMYDYLIRYRKFSVPTTPPSIARSAEGMVTEEMVEKGARAICNRYGWNPDEVQSGGMISFPHPLWKVRAADVRAALEAALAARPDGWVLVPREPTEAMRNVIENASVVYGTTDELWSALVAAAQPEQGEGAHGK